MKKFFLFLIFILLVIIFGALFYINANGANIIARFLSKQMKTEVFIDSASLGLREISLKGFRILNPEGSTLPDAFKADSISVTFQPSSLFNNIVLVEQITITNPTVTVEFYNLKGTDNNWMPIFQNLSKESDTDKKSTPKSSKRVIIDNLLIDHLTIQAQHRMMGSYSLNLPIKNTLEFHNLSDEKALAYKQAIAVIFKTILEPITKTAGFKDLLSNIKSYANVPDDLIKKIISQIPQEETTKKTTPPVHTPDWEDLEEEVQNTPKKIKDYFEKLFNK